MTVEIRKDISDILVPSDTLADAFNLTRPRIIQLAKENILLRDKNSKYALLDNVKRYIDYVKNGGKTEESNDEFQACYWEEKALHEKAKRELTEIRLAKIQGKMHDAKDVELVMMEMLSNLRTQILGLPSQLAPQLVNKSQEEIFAIINDEVERKLGELKDYTPELFESECVDDDSSEDS